MVLDRDTFRRLCLAQEMLREVSEQPLTVPQIARASGISPFHFIRQFHALHGSTPHQFRMQSRLETARILLARGDLSVTDVCMEVGFSSLGSFSTLFTRAYGTSPSDYRRRARSLVSIPANFQRELFPGCLSLLSCLPASAFRNFQEA